jgi:sporadic carbohydrate cluster protein (TIGR04323 family)
LSNRRGFRGYIGTRMEMGRSTPQHIQQMVMRDYCQRKDMTYLLAAVEYRMPGCTMVLGEVLGELEGIQGIVMYSIFLLPSSRAKRMDLYRRLFDAGATLHAAAEGVVVAGWDDAMRLEESWLAHDVMRSQKQEDFNFLKEWDQKDVHAAH